MRTKKRITITIHPSDYEDLKAIAKENSESISGMITRFIINYRFNHKK